MKDMPNKNKDCEVCNKLIKEKHRNDFLWKIACLILAVLSIVFAYLYFGSGAVKTETEIKIDHSTVENSGANGTIIIGNEGEIVTGTIENTDYTPIICISIIFAAVIIVGGIIIAYNHKKDD